MAIWPTDDPECRSCQRRTVERRILSIQSALNTLQHCLLEQEVDMPEVSRISVQEARQEVNSGRALLVCAYEQEEKCNQVALEGSLSLSQFQQRLPSMPKDQELIFFCA
jgi:hypothetical protein